MLLSEKIFDDILSLYNAGKTQVEIAELLKQKQPYINRLISQKSACKNIKIGTFEEMYPNASVELYKNGNGIVNAGRDANGATAIGSAKNVKITTPSQITNGTLEEARQILIDDIMTTDVFDAETKVKFYQFLSQKKNEVH